MVIRLFLKALVVLCTAALLSPRSEGADVQALAQQLASENASSRATAIAELRKMGAPACEALAKIETSETMPRQQLLLVRRIQGDCLIAQSPLQPLDRAKLSPFGEDVKQGIAGNPALLTNRDKKFIVMDGEFWKEQAPLDYLVVTLGPDARLHETILAVFARPREICYALLACFYTYAGELDAEGKVNLPAGAGVMISVEYLWEPAHADMDTPLDPADVINAFQKKYAVLLLGKVPAQERDNLLLDLSSDHGFLKTLLDHEEVDEKTGNVAAPSPFTEQLRNERCVYDTAALTAFANMLQDYLKKHPALAAAAAQPRSLPEKKLVRVPIEFFAWNLQTNRPMKRAPFAFTGSKFEKDPETKKMIFRADQEKSIVACRFDPYALLNSALDTRAISPYRALGYNVNWRAVPRHGTKCRVVFEPWTGGELKDEDLKDTGDTVNKQAPPP
ncbi:MAG: YdjY domain-containing protein [Planctomycetota bacterium]